ncbi:MAG: glycosyltransferase family 87 protein [Phenylobacterium sp.]|uniref:glycosyltransferase family 87 protein n=1 Tax=Phenylobacterium sp. TaxID=1871053 RepID=UPI002736FD72|nr:glycosyltransferase family 87 protein [Phenylobacterium sp.]MDP3173707.1 glycosyltransferase family 87 protein [Phenylobacterium sp.]
MRKPGEAPSITLDTIVRVAPLSLLALEIAFLCAGLQQHAWLTDAAGAPLCRDFSVFWASGRLAGQGMAAATYDWPSVQAMLVREGLPRDCNLPMFYPPSMLLLVTPFGQLPYAWAGALWIAVTLTAFTAAVRLATGRNHDMTLALAAPAALACVMVGQNGLLTAALAVAGLALLDRRPVLAGVLLGLMAYKPHFGVLLPLVLMATGRWRAFAGAAASAICGAMLAGLAFGWSSYPLFLHAMHAGGEKVIQAGVLEAYKQQSAYALVHALGGGTASAWAAQGLASAAVALGVVWVWRSPASFHCRLAALLTGLLAASPYSWVYDFPLYAAAAILLLSEPRTKPHPFDTACVIAAYMAPLAYGHLPIPIGPFIALLLAAPIARRSAAADQGLVSFHRARASAGPA